MALNDTKTFTYTEGGLTLEVTATDNGDGTTSFTVTCLAGFADVNALYWNDGVADGASVDLGKSLNMNGSGEDWDGAYKLSSTGLGSEGTAKDTYLTVGDGGYTFEATVDWDTIDTIGIRATSTNTDGGSIKGVADCPDIYHAPVASDDVWALSDTLIPVGTITPEWLTHNDTDLDGDTLSVTAINGQNDGRGHRRRRWSYR